MLSATRSGNATFPPTDSHRGCVTPMQVEQWWDIAEQDTSLIDGYDELPSELQAKILRALKQGHVDDEDWKGDLEKNRPGQKGFRVKTPKKAKNEVRRAHEYEMLHADPLSRRKPVDPSHQQRSRQARNARLPTLMTRRRNQPRARVRRRPRPRPTRRSPSQRRRRERHLRRTTLRRMLAKKKRQRRAVGRRRLKFLLKLTVTTTPRPSQRRVVARRRLLLLTWMAPTMK